MVLSEYDHGIFHIVLPVVQCSSKHDSRLGSFCLFIYFSYVASHIQLVNTPFFPLIFFSHSFFSKLGLILYHLAIRSNSSPTLYYRKFLSSHVLLKITDDSLVPWKKISFVTVSWKQNEVFQICSENGCLLIMEYRNVSSLKCILSLIVSRAIYERLILPFYQLF